ncbi:MAG: citrate synthase/methylcitrate synthase [Candidatus Caldarchaeum sp.]|nr:citrate synthase/methylcitrate synthase [Candidatus Caldarchaeum sp.]MDW8435682.1 citrate synthase/methylcitrate synthase [Candidatus Caldarchaeum sp.]
MVDSQTDVLKGLENVPIKYTSLSSIDGQQGKLYYVGYAIEDLVEHSSYEEVCFLLLNRRLPTRDELQRYEGSFRRERELPNDVFGFLKKFPRDAPLISVLRAGVDLLALYDEEVEKTDPARNHSIAIRIISRMATLLAASYRLKQGLDPVPPAPDLQHAANFLYMATGRRPTPLESRIMDVAFILHAEHELPASTTAALVVASTLSDLYSAVSAGIGALKGPLHGGANERALEMLFAIGDPDKAEQYINAELAAKRRIMGFGHRVYKSFDPRALIFKNYLKKLADVKSDWTLLRTAEKVEELMVAKMKDKSIFPNIDLYSGPVFHLLGLNREIFTPIFAVARAVGWIAHVLEYWEDNRLIRPRAVYNGPPPRQYVPLDQR